MTFLRMGISICVNVRIFSATDHGVTGRLQLGFFLKIRVVFGVQTRPTSFWQIAVTSLGGLFRGVTPVKFVYTFFYRLTNLTTKINSS